jgi:plasmid stabilization system protein ParE
MKYVFTPEAEAQATEMDTWWREHRPAARGLFAQELADVLTLVTRTPGVGTTHKTNSGKALRRVLMPKTKNHVYFEVDLPRDQVIVHAVWGTPRGRGPNL